MQISIKPTTDNSASCLGTQQEGAEHIKEEPKKEEVESKDEAKEEEVNPEPIDEPIDEKPQVVPEPEPQVVPEPEPKPEPEPVQQNVPKSQVVPEKPQLHRIEREQRSVSVPKPTQSDLPETPTKPQRKVRRLCDMDRNLSSSEPQYFCGAPEKSSQTDWSGIKYPIGFLIVKFIGKRFSS